jgi:BCD family chlorophyll transporter-like MFS transporter
MAMFGAAVGIPAFAAIMLASLHQSIPVFVTGTVFVGFGTGLFSHGNLTLTMNLAPKDQAGLALGAWGAVQATAAGIAVASGGVLRDVFDSLAIHGALGPNMTGSGAGYTLVYLIEIVLLVATVFVMTWLTHDRLAVATTPA